MTIPTKSPTVTMAQPRPGGLRELIHLAYPVVLTQLCSTLMGVVDSAMVGRLGPTQLAAVGFGAIWLWTVFSLFYGTASGVQTFVSQHDGAGEPRRCGAWAWHGFYTVVPAALLTVLLAAPWLESILALLGPSQAVQSAAESYLRARLPGEVAFAVWMVFTSFFRGIGDTRTPLYVTIFVNVVNAVLDYGLIFGRLGLPAWGVTGAGAATSMAHWLGAFILFAIFLRRGLRERFDTRPVLPRAAAIRRFLRTGAPIGGQWFIDMTSFAFFTTLIARMGDASMAASQAFVMLLSLSFMQAVGISIAASTLVGRYVGAGQPEAANRSFGSALVLGIGLAALVAVLFVVIPGPLLRIFTDDPAIVALGRPLLAIGALFQLFDAIAIVTEGSLRGAGDTRWPFLVVTAFGWGLFVPLAYVLGVTLEGGLSGAWSGGVVSLGLMSMVLVRRFRSGAWQRIRI
jgi:MATE family multidrug resistance protein